MHSMLSRVSRRAAVRAVGVSLTVSCAAVVAPVTVPVLVPGGAVAYANDVHDDAEAALAAAHRMVSQLRAIQVRVEDMPQLAEAQRKAEAIRAYLEGVVAGAVGQDPSGAVLRLATELHAYVQDQLRGQPAIIQLLSDAEALIGFLSGGDVVVPADPTDAVAGVLPDCLDPAEERQPTQVGVPENVERDILRALGSFGDADDPGYVPAIVGQTITLGDCVPANVVAGPGSVPSATVDGTSTTGVIEQNSFADDATNLNDPPPPTREPAQPATRNVVNPPVLVDDYGAGIPDYDGESGLGAVWMVYRSSFLDDRGVPMVVWQNADVDAGPKTKFYTAIGGVHQEMGPDIPFLAADPLGEKIIEESEGVTAAVNFSVQKKDTAEASVSLSRSFSVEHTMYGGGRYFHPETGKTYATYGGNRQIAEGHRRQNRAWSHGGAWVMPKSGAWRFTVWVSATYKKCC